MHSLIRIKNKGEKCGMNNSHRSLRKTNFPLLFCLDVLHCKQTFWYKFGRIASLHCILILTQGSAGISTGKQQKTEE